METRTYRDRAKYMREYHRDYERKPEQVERDRQSKAAWIQRNTEATKAHGKVARAIKAGKLVRPSECERCGTECKPDASHHDYSKPLDVEWLCKLCHAKKDRYGE